MRVCGDGGFSYLRPKPVEKISDHKCEFELVEEPMKGVYRCKICGKVKWTYELKEIKDGRS